MTSTSMSLPEAPISTPAKPPDVRLVNAARRVSQLLLLGAVIIAAIAAVATLRERSAYVDARDARTEVAAFDQATAFDERVRALVRRDDADNEFEERHGPATVWRGNALIAVATAAPAFIAWMALLVSIAGRAKGRPRGALTAAAIWTWFIPAVNLCVPPFLLHQATREGWGDDSSWNGREAALYASWWIPWIVVFAKTLSDGQDAARSNSIRWLVRTSTSYDALGTMSSMVWTMALLVLAGIAAIAVVEMTTREVARRVARAG